ncbi:hypothetical protein ACAW74_25805 [Fibrella sp. WM1]|uniref:hypothetical protein n=1 Tax=Fibrella musci TaxID=3242485 RepID=UPI0035205E7F
MKNNPNEPRTLWQNNRFHQLIQQCKLEKDEKEELVYLVSGERTRTSAELTFHEMDKAIKRLEGPISKSIKKMRAKIYGLYRDIAELPPMEEYTFQQKDFDAVNSFLVRCFKLKLHELDYKTLTKAVTAMEKWHKWGIDKAVKRILNDQQQ